MKNKWKFCEKSMKKSLENHPKIDLRGVLGPLGLSYRRPGASRGRLGPSWERLGPSWQRPGGVLGRLGGVLVANMVPTWLPKWSQMQ